jgi:hypothetical protein
MSLTFAKTLVPESVWSRMDEQHRRRAIWVFWAITWIGLGAGLFDARYWRWVAWFSIAHALLAWVLVGFRPLAFPAQLRLAFAAWILAGTFVPGLTWLLYVPMAGVAANLTVGYCPLARMLYLLPWNREEPFHAGLLLRVFLTPPMPGRFRLGRHAGRVPAASV